MDPSVVQQLVEEITKKTLAALSHSADSPMSETGDLAEETAEDQTEPSCKEIIHRNAVAPNTAEAQRFLQLLSKPPPLQDMKMQAQSVVVYSGVPETPAPRRNKVDLSLYTVQHKLEVAMHLLTQSMDTSQVISMVQAAAWIRSGWEDLQQQRRSYMAGRQAWKLDQRSDDQKAKLLSPEEEKKIKVPSRPKTQPPARSVATSSWHNQEWTGPKWKPREHERPRSFTQSRSRKGGKGKAKQK
jgi:hypothetical protein